MLVAVLDELWVGGVQLIALLRRLSPSPFFQKRRVCSCFNIIITRSRVHEEEALWSEDIVILYGCWIACTKDTLSGNCRYYLPKESLVSSTSWFLPSTRLLTPFPVNGRHLSADVTFIEKRRRGLVRFLNALVRHPVLSQEQLVVMFLTVPTVSLIYYM